MTALSPKPEPAFYRHCTVFVETGQKGFLERPDLQQNQEILVYSNQAYAMMLSALM